jgi:CspA family cold shock protein
MDVRDDRRRVGVVKFWNVERNFGFIAPEDGGEDAFLGLGALEAADIGPPKAGDKLSFVIGLDRQGRRRAEDIEPVGDDDGAAALDRLFSRAPARP